MAIIVEEEKKLNTGFASAIGWVVILGVLAAAAYYFFFASPIPGIVTPPPGYSTIAPITQIGFDPTSVASSPAFQSLQQYIPQPSPTGPAPVGKTNPFVQ